jgi:uncharacterized protein YdeI (BOF family)
MTSAIVTDNIDVDYPVAGQDNDSQGFRDNFSAISNALATAASEITVLQTTTAKLNDTNDFEGNIIQNATTKNVYSYAYSTTGNAVNIVDGDFQTIDLTSNTLNLVGWQEKENTSVKIKIAINAGNVSRVVSISSANSESIKTSYGATISIPQNKTAVVEVWSNDSGLNVFIHSLGIFE